VLTCFVLHVEPTVTFLFLLCVLLVILVSHFCSISALNQCHCNSF
jgi:hypothetical protein